jgi:meiosis-specific APC/C activator protein AMA1
LPQQRTPTPRRALPSAPFKVLDAPNLRDDFYCSVLAYSATSQTLAVSLGNVLYVWSERLGVRTMHGMPLEGVWVTSTGFSSTKGGKSILAIGRSDGMLTIKSLSDGLPRFEIQQPYSVACLSWRPVCTSRSVSGPCMGCLSKASG